MIKSKQLKNGNNKERETGEFFKEHGYWAHIFAKSNSGSQPCDVIALKDNINWLVDSKNVENERTFNFSRVEPNQESCFDYAKNFSKLNNLGFVIWFEKFDSRPYFMSYDKFLGLKEKGSKSANMSDLELLENLI